MAPSCHPFVSLMIHWEKVDALHSPLLRKFVEVLKQVHPWITPLRIAHRWLCFDNAGRGLVASAPHINILRVNARFGCFAQPTSCLRRSLVAHTLQTSRRCPRRVAEFPRSVTVISVCSRSFAKLCQVANCQLEA